jgi:hypothetical protein
VKETPATRALTSEEGHTLRRTTIAQGNRRSSIRRIALAAFIFSLSLSGTRSALAADTYLYGTLTNVTVGSAGDLLIMLSTGVPTNCTGVPYGWMMIPAANKTMIALAILTMQGHGAATVYTYPLSGGQCVINQFDPDESTL